VSYFLGKENAQMYTILIVDDNVYDREGVRDLVDWESLNIQIVGMAVNGDDGFRKAIELKPDIILTDVAMPLMNGIQMTHKIKEELPKTFFIFMSCFDEFDYVKSAINLDVSSYVLKPIELDELIRTLQKIIQTKREENNQLVLMEELRTKVQMSIPLLKGQFMRELLHGSKQIGTNIQEKMNYLDIPNQGTFIIIIIQIDQFDELYGNAPVEDRYITIYHVKKIVEETILKCEVGYTFVEDTSNLCCIISGEWLNREQILDDVIDACSACHVRVQEDLGNQITIGISNFSNDISDLPQLYESANYAVKSKFYREGNKTILATELKTHDDGYNYNFGELKNDIGLMLEKGDPIEILEKLDHYFNEGASHNEIFAKSLSYSIINAIQIHLAERNENLSRIFDDETILWNKLVKFETILDIKQWMTNIIVAVHSYLDSRHTKRYKSIVEDIQKVIERDYATIQNVENIVESLYISASYGNHLFRQQTGKTIFEYLISVRMESAKKMLEDPYCKVYMIAEAVGYISTSYFGATFKGYTGLTPKQYRDKYSRS
jgi:two-component system, response regulator YesN